MRFLLGLAWLLAIVPIPAWADTACRCPSLSLDQQIGDAAYVFVGRPVITAPVPAGNSPFHSEMSILAPRAAVPNDWVTLFRIETLWKGASRRTVRVRHEQGDCAVSFKEDVPVIVFAQVDAAGVLWTYLCSGDMLQGDAGFDDLKQTLTSRLKFD
jgi:hypothetical protein